MGSHRWPPRLHPNRTGWYSIYRPRKDERLSWPSWLVTYRDGLPVHRRSPIQVLTGSDVAQLRCSRPTAKPNRHLWTDCLEAEISFSHNARDFNLSCRMKGLSVWKWSSSSASHSKCSAVEGTTRRSVRTSSIWHQRTTRWLQVGRCRTSL